jgi:2-keto-4-pentenoate hydratase/2-oxohepta-3-ene-1,7-dioic acid hydratase in catechol pathway
MATYTRFHHAGGTSFGLVEKDRIEQLRGGLFEPPVKTGRTFAASEVKRLVPVVPGKILAVGLNYKSHLGERKAPTQPEIFYKPISALQSPGGPILLPPDSTDVHFEGELVVVIGRTLRRASRADAESAVFGVTCGNDVSDRNWQRGPAKDSQYWRAKGCDTFAPVGPYVVTGINYQDLALETKLNGETVQHGRTSDLLFGVTEVLQFVSRYVTLERGDAIFTGTPGTTRAMKPGDVVEVTIEGIGTLQNPIAAG